MPPLNEKTARAIEIFLKRPQHALLLIGKNGVGSEQIAQNLAKQLAKNNVATLSPHIHKQQKTESINVDDINELHQIARNRQTTALAIVIEHSEKMTNRAPEAFLKLLEEPAENLYFILTTDNLDILPKTIVSRCQKINILPISDKTSETLLASVKNPRNRAQISFLAQGLPDEIAKLSTNEAYLHEKAAIFAKAKDFLSKKTYERLVIASQIKNREEAILFVEALSKLALKLPQTDARSLNILSDVSDNLSANGNIKAQLTYLALNMI